MTHPYFRPVVEMYKKLESGIEYSKSSQEYETWRILKHNQ